MYNQNMLYYILAFKDMLPPITLFAFTIAYCIAVLFAISFHELAHGYVAYKAGDLTAKSQGRLSLNPFKHIDGWGALCFLLIGFGWAKPVQINPLKFRNYKRDMLKVSLAGVTTNFSIAFLLSPLNYFFGPSLFSSSNVFLNFLGFLIQMSIIVNLSLFAFNLIPCYPLDGFNFIKTFLSEENRFVQFMYRYGSLILMLIIITPVFDWVYSAITGGFLELFSMFWGLFG